MGPHQLVFVGTYTTRLAHVDGKARGILVFRLDGTTGALTRIGCQAGIANPSYLAVEPRRHRLYAVSEVQEHAGRPGGAVYAYAIHPDGSLEALAQQPTSGLDPCFVGLDGTGSLAVAANYSSGSIAAFPLDDRGDLQAPSACIRHVDPAIDIDHAIGAARPRARRSPVRQEAPHAHSCVMDPRNERLYVCDLGCDWIFAYRLEHGSGQLTPDHGADIATPAGTGPRHLAFHPDGLHAYVLFELSSQLGVYGVAPDTGRLAALQTVTLLPEDYVSAFPASARGVTKDVGGDVRIHPSGRFLYASHRGHDSISAFAIDPGSGLLSLIGCERTRGRTPRGFAIDPSGTFLLAANQDTDTIATFRIDPRACDLAWTGHLTSAETPVCIAFLAQTA